MFSSLLRSTMACRAAPRPLHPFLSTRTYFQSNSLGNPLRLGRLPLKSSTREVSSFREVVKKSRPEESFEEKVEKPGIRNQLLFAGIGSIFAFCYAASRTNIETEYWKKRISEASSVWSLQSMTSTDLKRAQNSEVIRHLREWAMSINSKLVEMPALIRPWVSLAFVSVLQPYADASEGKRLTWKICLLNAGVYLAWKIRKWRPTMNVRFMHFPLSGLSFTLLTSMFSHKDFFHLLLNCLALESFGSAAYFYLMREQEKGEPKTLESTAAWHFLAFFVSAGLFSGVVSHVANAKFIYPRVIAQLNSAARATPKTETWASAVAAASKPAAEAAAKETTKSIPRILPSLGASGAIYATVTMTALAFPTSEVALFIPPSYPINIQTGVSCLVLLDIVGLLRGWRMFDHYAHLGGAAFGVLYYNYGPDFWNRMRRTFQIDPASIPQTPSSQQV